MDAKKFVENKEFNTSKGLPQGKTIIDFENADFKETDFTEDNGDTKKVNQVTIPIEGGKETYNLPISVMKKIKEAVKLGAAAVEINRDGTTRTDTKYVCYPLDTNGKVIKVNK